MQLGEALMNAGGNSFEVLMDAGSNPFVILKRHDNLLRTLADNNISVTAKYDGPEFKKQEDCTEENMEEQDAAMPLFPLKNNS